MIRRASLIETQIATINLKRKKDKIKIYMKVYNYHNLFIKNIIKGSTSTHSVFRHIHRPQQIRSEQIKSNYGLTLFCQKIC